MTVRNLAFLVFVTCLANVTQAEVITTWTFNELAEGMPIIAPAPTSGVGNALLIGGTTGVGGQGTPSGAIPAGTSWVLSNFPQQGTATKTAGIEFHVPTVGFQNISINYNHFISGDSADSSFIQVTYDGSNFSDAIQFPRPLITNPDTWYSRGVDLSLSQAANNNPNFGFRIVSSYNLNFSGNAYRAFANTGTYSPNANWRFDNILISGNAAVPEPHVLGLSGLLMIAVGFFRGRRSEALCADYAGGRTANPQN